MMKKDQLSLLDSFLRELVLSDQKMVGKLVLHMFDQNKF